MFARSHRKLLHVAAIASVLVAASIAQAAPVLPVLIKQAVFARSSLKAAPLHTRKTLSLALPNDIVTETHVPAQVELLPNEAEAAPNETGMFFGPNFIDPTHATQVRAMVKTMPDRAKKILSAPVGPWAMSGLSVIGNGWSAGPALYAHFQ
jgi:hypothetical protein